MDHIPTPEESRKFSLFISALAAICSIVIMMGFYLFDGFFSWGIVLVCTVALIAMGVIFLIELPRRPDKPTLGGLRKAREFLHIHGIDFPVFEHSLKYELGSGYRGKSASLDDLIAALGPLYEMGDVRLKSEKGRHFAMFVFGDAVSFDEGTQWQLSIEDLRTVDNLARYGRPRPTWHNRMRFSFLPDRHAAEVF